MSIHESALGLKMMGILTSVDSLLLCANTFELKCTIYQLPPCHNIHTSESFKHARYEWRLLLTRAASKSGLFYIAWIPTAHVEALFFCANLWGSTRRAPPRKCPTHDYYYEKCSVSRTECEHFECKIQSKWPFFKLFLVTKPFGGMAILYPIQVLSCIRKPGTL